MAEVIGILSGAITFIDAGIKVANLLSSLKNAPKRIAAYQEELQGTVQLVNTIKNDLDRLSNGTGLIPQSLVSQPDLDELQRYIQEAAEIAKQVEAFLDVATASPQAGRMEKSWKAVRARKLQGEITERLERMGGLKASIQFWLNRQTYLISAGQVGSNIHINRSIQALQDRLDSMEGVLHAATSSAEVSISAAVQRSQHAVVAVVKDEIRMLHQPTGGNQSTHASAVSQQALSKVSFPAAKCACKRRPSPYLSMGPIYFRDDKRHVHEERCPLRHSSNRSMLFGLRTSLFHLQFVGSFGARGFALTPQVKLPGRVVDVTQSSTFLFMRSTLDRGRDPIDDENPVQTIKDICSELTTGLSIRFANLDGFAHDQDQNGRTLLHEFIESMTKWRKVSGDLTNTFDAIDSVVSLLISYGADPNATASWDRKRDWNGGTPMDHTIWDRNFGADFRDSRVDGPPANPLLEVVLQKHGCELSDFTDPGAANINTILLCMHDPEFAIELGFPNYYLPIFRKSLAQLGEMTTKGQDWNDYDKRFASPVECSLLWSDGLKYLLDWGKCSFLLLITVLRSSWRLYG
ncbi:hypothetical protein BFW01_g514 [Lasiodiplodia theobromae]|nr:hypothetical protein BFW01_g514 [Lasiodiplodia theobromae]